MNIFQRPHFKFCEYFEIQMKEKYEKKGKKCDNSD